MIKQILYQFRYRFSIYIYIYSCLCLKPLNRKLLRFFSGLSRSMAAQCPGQRVFGTKDVPSPPTHTDPAMTLGSMFVNPGDANPQHKNLPQKQNSTNIKSVFFSVMLVHGMLFFSVKYPTKNPTNPNTPNNPFPCTKVYWGLIWA